MTHTDMHARTHARTRARCLRNGKTFAILTATVNGMMVGEKGRGQPTQWCTHVSKDTQSMSIIRAGEMAKDLESF